MPSFESRTNETLSIDLILQKLSAFEVENRLRKLDGRKAFGYDEVHPLVLKKCSRALVISLSIIFQLSMMEGKIPNLSRHANVSPIFKKGSRVDRMNYRPVSLTSIV